LSRGDTPIGLGHLTYKLLWTLVEFAPNVVSHDRIVERVWNGRATSPETVTQRVKLLRDALGDDADQPRYVRVLRNQGYQLIPNVEALAAVPAAAVTPVAAPKGGRPGSREPERARVVWLAAGAVALAAVAVTALLQLTPEGAVPPESVSIAVLPLENLSGDADQEYFADGMTEALITSLAQLRGLNVISRRSVLRYRGTTEPLPDIARELGVTTVLEGSTQLVRDRVQITAQLIDARTDRHLWAKTYESPVTDVLRLQSEIARAVAAEVEVAVSPEEAERLAAAPQVDIETYRAYLRGMHHLSKVTPNDLDIGMAYLREAVDRDPGNALAYAGLALGYVTLGHGPEPNADVWPLARAAAERAIALDPNLAEAHAALGDVKLYMLWDWEGAEQAFKRANELAPSLAMNHYHYAWYLALFGRWDEAAVEHERARELDPLTPLHTLWLGGLYLYEDLGRHDDAELAARRALEIQPDNPVALLVLGMAQSAAGKHEAAIETHRRMVELNPDLKWELGLTYVRAGDVASTRAIVEELERRPTTSWTAYGLAMLHAQLGEIDKAFEYLAFEPPHAWLPWIRQDPWLRPLLEKDPRFFELLDRLGLPP
jgi:TolB-like protein/DNA-binding winged helix-turn-helix (wHTH) protein/Tfp pilus assembly protein PilF